MNKREKLFLLWALLASVLVIMLALDRTNLSIPPLPFVAAPANDEVLFHKLALRLLNPRNPNDPNADSVQLLVGKLPERLPVKPEIPKDTRLIGSQIDRSRNTSVFLESDQPPSSILDFYRQFFPSAGWTILDEKSPTGGFTYGDPSSSLTFCNGLDQPAIFVNAFRPRNEPTDVRIAFYDARATLCAGPGAPTLHSASLIPDLRPPEHGYLKSRGEGGSDEDAASSSLVESELDLASFAKHYETQLEQGGWMLRERGQTGPIAWSTWTVHDKFGENWRGIFFALDLDGTSSRRLAYVRIDRTQ